MASLYRKDVFIKLETRSMKNDILACLNEGSKPSQLSPVRERDVIGEWCLLLPYENTGKTYLNGLFCLEATIQVNCSKWSSISFVSLGRRRRMVTIERMVARVVLAV